MTPEEYKKELEFYAEKLAYTSFANNKFSPLKQRGATSDSIKSFKVVFFFIQKLNKDGSTIVELTVRYTLKLQPPGFNSDEEITFTKESGAFENAIVDQIYIPELGPYQHFNFSFGKPNPIQLFDAEFVLEEKLGLENDEDE